MKSIWLFCFLLLCFFQVDLFAQVDHIPKTYLCQKTEGPIIIDGKGDDAVWNKSSWTDLFVDIERSNSTLPTLKTKMKMVWDEAYFYFYAEMEEPHLWATLTKRDAVIFHDNDFEIFIDPNGDTHNYYELEMNALNTVWDLLLTRPYRDQGHAINAWDIQGLKTAVKLNGTLNDPSDVDEGWSVEIAIPWKVLREAAGTATPPKDGDQWRLNFSRVQWDLEVIDGKYQKKKDANGKNLPEHNWVWSPQRAIAMHEPEFWGIVEFAEADKKTPSFNQRGEEIRQALYQIHRAQKAYFRKNKTFANSIEQLNLPSYTFSNGEKMIIEVDSFDPTSQYSAGITISVQHEMQTFINETGRLWHKNMKNE